MYYINKKENPSKTDFTMLVEATAVLFLHNLTIKLPYSGSMV